ncbi:MAG: Octaprenyl-diphosphate synthase [Deltaproteobacteria bacterium ADurb.BinA179]|jgi:octaprenyl-diphosphate synthase|nr:polyprenyl synthetase family protein [Deltaproteobacteria bacterium]MDI9542117.1 polyprenyl synthetase family protein [Pseudomonadota bacterium]OPZ29946.1 MAG: Octaprenyl-diphosphate synthase [Deltaproteobacteria bacterium ADurb.BinA179]HRR21369.1 polyprenyl synthetase family protein [Desulfomonilia bacterium]HOD71778.1 polyprenyl synthetase family protein [Deltaproteobacteria bacterium]
MDASFEKNLQKIFQSSTRYTTQIGEYILGSGGKRLRPKLVMLIGRALGISDEKIMPVAYTVELMHTASLLHDDVVDGTAIRRARPTANQVFGDKPALLVGDFISASAIETMCGIDSLDLIRAMVQTIRKMAEGELKELEYAQTFHDRLDVYLDIIYLKTATLFEYCAYAPGVLAGLSDGALDALVTYGRAVGMGFQIVDDIINLAPSQDDNKDPFNDILEGKSTLPLVIIFQENPQVLDSVSRLTEPEKKVQFLAPYITSQVLQESRDIARDHLERARDALRRTGILMPELEQIPDSILAQLERRF